MHHIPGSLSLVLLDIGANRQKHQGICRQVMHRLMLTAHFIFA